MTTTSGDDEEYLAEIVRKSSVGIAAFTTERVLLAAVAYVTTTVLGAAAYGFLSVFTRGEVISRNLVAGLGDGYTRTVPRVSASARRTVLSVGTVGFVVVWAVVATAIVLLRGPLIDATLLEPRHESVVVLFAVGLLPFLLLRNIRDMFRALRRIRVAMLVSRIFTPLTLLVGVMFAVFTGGQSLFSLWLGVAAAALAAAVAGTILLAYGTDLSIGRFHSHQSVVRDFLRYSVDATGVAVLELVQRWAVFAVMALYLSPVGAGAFSLSIIVGLVVRWPLSGVNGILPPIAAALYSDGETQTLQRLYQQTSRLATVVTTPVFALGYVYAPDILAVFNDAYAQQSAVLRLVLTGQYAATVFGSVGLLLLMTDNERASLRIQVINASISLPLMIILTVRFGPRGLGAAYLVSLLLNNTTEFVLLYVRDGFVPFSREQAYTALVVVPLITGVTLIRSVAGSTTTALVVVAVVGSYVWFGRRFLLRSADRSAVRALLG